MCNPSLSNLKAIWPLGLSWGQLSLCLKFLYTARFENAIKAIKNHRDKIRESVFQIFDSPSKNTDVLATTVVEKVFRTMSLDAILDIQSYSLKQLVDTPPSLLAFRRQNPSTSTDLALSSKADPGWKLQE